MARLKIRYLVKKPGGNGPLYYWQPTRALAQAGWKPKRLSDDLAAAIAEAEGLNQELDAWRRGERSEDAPAEIATTQPGSVAEAIRRYKAESRRYKRIAPSTRREYNWLLGLVEDWAGDQPLRGITRDDLQTFYDEMFEVTPAKANALLRALSAMLTFAVQKGLASQNIVAHIEKTRTEARLRIASPEEIDALVSAADALGYPSIGDAVLAACDLGQRQGDLLRLPRFRVQNSRMLLQQSKRRARIDCAITPRLAARIEARDARVSKMNPTPAALIVCEMTEKNWHRDTFRHTFSEVRAKAAESCPTLSGYWENDYGAKTFTPQPDKQGWRHVPPLWFADLRDTFVTNAATAGATIPEIAAVTGHAERSVYSILRHYLSLSGEMADNAIRKMMDYYDDQAPADACADRTET